MYEMVGLMKLRGSWRGRRGSIGKVEDQGEMGGEVGKNVGGEKWEGVS